jgi:hypothetical protein
VSPKSSSIDCISFASSAYVALEDKVNLFGCVTRDYNADLQRYCQ